VRTATVVKLCVQIVKSFVARPDADEIRIGQKELAAFLGVGLDGADHNLHLLHRAFHGRNGLADARMHPFHHPL